MADNGSPPPARDYSSEALSNVGRILLPGVPGSTSRGFLGYCTVFLFRLDNQWALFDTGHHSDRHLLLTELRKTNLTPNDIRFVVLSHLHFDHSLNLPIFKSAEVFISKAELAYAGQAASGDIDDPSIPDHWPRLLEGRTVHQVDRSLQLSSNLSLSLTPGHTPGCMALFREGDNRAVICGDAVKNAWEAVRGKADMALAGEQASADSIQKIKDWQGLIIPGHDRPFKIFGNRIIYLAGFRWQVRATLYPEPKNKPVLDFDLSPGPAEAAGGEQSLN